MMALDSVREALCTDILKLSVSWVVVASFVLPSGAAFWTRQDADNNLAKFENIPASIAIKGRGKFLEIADTDELVCRLSSGPK